MLLDQLIYQGLSLSFQQSQTVTFYGLKESEIYSSVYGDRIEKSSDGYPEIRVIANLPPSVIDRPLNVFLAEKDYVAANDLGAAAE